MWKPKKGHHATFFAVTVLFTFHIYHVDFLFLPLIHHVSWNSSYHFLLCFSWYFFHPVDLDHMDWRFPIHGGTPRTIQPWTTMTTGIETTMVTTGEYPHDSRTPHGYCLYYSHLDYISMFYIAMSYHTVDGCEILHHQPDGFQPQQSNGIFTTVETTGAGFRTLPPYLYWLVVWNIFFIFP